MTMPNGFLPLSYRIGLTTPSAIAAKPLRYRGLCRFCGLCSTREYLNSSPIWSVCYRSTFRYSRLAQRYRFRPQCLRTYSKTGV